MSLQRWLFGLVCLCTAAILVASADAQTAAKKTDKKSTAKKDDKKNDKDYTLQILANLETWFKQHDLNNDQQLDLSEITKALGIGARAADYRKADTDGDKLVSKAEHDAWAAEYAPKLAAEWQREEAELAAAIEKAQAALAKANAQAKQQYQQAVERQRQQMQRLRDRNRFNDRFRRNRR